jgi:hypothetical protein
MADDRKKSRCNQNSFYLHPASIRSARQRSRQREIVKTPHTERTYTGYGPPAFSFVGVYLVTLPSIDTDVQTATFSSQSLTEPSVICHVTHADGLLILHQQLLQLWLFLHSASRAYQL